ncbi:MAG: hypothetical protein M3680_18310 [Myxococcota bacterium]|nr:hypothetical protein [Myxococcota bacterium]
MKHPVRTGTTIAFAAASLFAAACSKDEPAAAPTSTIPQAAPAVTDTPAPAAPDKTAPAMDEKTAKVHCQGANSCKGQGGCKSAANACAGKNGCKGHGFVATASEEECKAKGGTVMAKM